MGRMKSELFVLKRMILRFCIAFGVVFGGLFFLTLKPVTVLGGVFLFPVFGSPSLVTQLFLSAKSFLVPADIPLVALGPVSSFTAPIMTALLLTILLVFPYGLYLFGTFLRPALYQAERGALSRILLPALVLFYLGCTLAYTIIIPQTFRILYSFSAPIGVTPLFALDTFISTVFLLTLAVGLTFLLPIVMAILTRFRLVPQGFWLRHWRGAVLATVIFSAVVTPDGSGVTMVFLSIPLLVLYGLGAVMYLSFESSV